MTTKTRLSAARYLSQLIALFLATIPIASSSSGDASSDHCLGLYSQIWRKIPQSLPNDPSLVALKNLYGDRIEIEQRNEGPWIYLRAEDKTRDIFKIKELGIGTYNVLNLLESEGKEILKPNAAKNKGLSLAAAQQTEGKLSEQGKMLLDEKNDIQFGQEVESLQAAQRLNQDYLEDSYRPILIRGNNLARRYTPESHIAIFLKKDLPFDVEIQSHRQLQTEYLGRNSPIFNQDLPVILLRPKGAEKTDRPFLILMAQHLKSKRSTPGDPNSELRRQLQIKRSVEIQEKLEAKYPGIPILSAGDFNGDLMSDSAFEPFWKQAELKDSFDLATKSVRKKHRVTHTYHPGENALVKSQLDGVLVSRAGQIPELVKKAKIVSYRDNYGRKKALPQNIQEREQNPSDHFMISTRWDFRKLLENYVRSR